MEPTKRLGRPRLLSDIPETDQEGLIENMNPQIRSATSTSPFAEPQQQSHSKSTASWLTQPRPPHTDKDSELLRPRTNVTSLLTPTHPLPKRPLTPFFKSIMASPSGSAPATTSYTDLPALLTSPPSPTSKSQSHDASHLPIAPGVADIDHRQASPPSSRRGRARYRSSSRSRPSFAAPVQTGTMNLKQLTCHWWYQTGNCRFSSKDCLYAHHDTGRYAEAPRQVVPGQPAVAGRNADRKVREIENHLTTLRLDKHNTHLHSQSGSSLADHPFSAPPNGGFSLSRPSTPGGLMIRSPVGMGMPMAAPGPGMFPIVSGSPLHYATSNAAALEGEVKFFRTLVEQGGKEKEVMVSTIESLQAENQTLRAESESHKSDNKRLTEERDALRGALSLLQQQNGSQSNPGSRNSTPMSALRSSSFADFGAIGPKRLGA